MQSYKKNEYEKFQQPQHPKPLNIIITQKPQNYNWMNSKMGPSLQTDTLNLT